jgi:hypothetical protein
MLERGISRKASAMKNPATLPVRRSALPIFVEAFTW